MHLKYKLRCLLREYLKLHPNTNHKHTLTHPRELMQFYKQGPAVDRYKLIEGSNLSTSSFSCFMRILIVSKTDADAIRSILDQHKKELGIVSLNSSSTEYQDTYPHSVVIESSLYDTLIATWELYGTQDRLNHNVRQSIRRDLGGISDEPRHIVIDFSSPNIAKPFHYGHLKSTILGNYLANLNIFLANKVTKLNYLGDWGTQYGLVSLGFDRFGDENKLKKNPLRHLLDIYIQANNLAKADDTFYSLAREKFLLMDKIGDPKQLDQWSKFRDLSLSELKISYERLGIEFDVYDFESDYRRQARELVHLLEDKELLKSEANGAKLIEIIKNKQKFFTPILKSDGTSLYLTRDIAAAIDRKERYNFDEMLYVVGQEQEHHMSCLFDAIRQLDINWYDKLKHIETGKVLGMSSRSGEFVLLDDILDEVTKRYIKSTKSTSTSKLDHDYEVQEVSHLLALSALFVYDMRNPRKRSYSFDWDTIMLTSPKSGLALQAAYARLSSLIATFPDIDPRIANGNAIVCIESVNLLTCLAKFDDVLFHSNQVMDPSPLVHYAFELCNCSNRALQSKHLRIRGEAEDIASTRLALFSCVHNVLGTIIKLIGLKPLQRI